jgi:hypothetical protein
MNKTKINLNFLAFALASSFGLSAFATALSKTTPVDIYQEDWRKERDQFRADLNKRIEKNKKDIRSLKSEAQNQKENNRKKYNDAITDLGKRNDRLLMKLGDYKDDSKDNWQNFKREINHDIDELTNAITDLMTTSKK